MGGRRKGFDAALVDDRGVLELAGGLTCSEVVRFVEAARPAVFSVDSPRCCAPAGEATRACERLLARAVCGIRWTPDAARVRAGGYYAWIVEGLALFDALASHAIGEIVAPPGRW